MDNIRCYNCMSEENCNCSQDEMLIAENEYLRDTLAKSREANLAAIERAIEAETKLKDLEKDMSKEGNAYWRYMVTELLGAPGTCKNLKRWTSKEIQRLQHNSSTLWNAVKFAKEREE